MKKFFFLLVAVLTVLTAKAVNEVYTSYNDATKTLTYYFDDQREARHAAGEITELYDPVNNRTAKRFQTYHDDILTVKIDVSMQNANLTSAVLMFSGGYDESNFYSLHNMTEIQGMENLVTDNVTDMNSMFHRCRSLQSVDLSRFNTANVTDMSLMFDDCRALKMLDLCSFNTSKVTNMTCMFCNCTALERICSNTDWSLTSTALQYSEWMFADCPALIGCAGTICDGAKRLDDIPYARPDGGTAAPGYFTTKQMEIYTVYDAEVLTYYYDDQRHFREGITEVYDPSDPEKPRFKGYNESVVAAVIDESMKNANLTSTAYMFNGGSLSGEDFSLTNMQHIFGMQFLVTDNVWNMSDMFYKCKSLRYVDYIGNLNTANVTSMFGMFAECYKLEHLDLSHFNTAKVTNMVGMFQNCQTLTELDLSSFNTANVVYMDNMFDGCSSLDSLGLLSFNTAKVTSMFRMFCNCANLRVVDIHSFNIASLTSSVAMFAECGKLKTIYCNGRWDQSELLANSDNMFWDCVSLRGGNGLAYGVSYVDKQNARPDKSPDRGYFTSVKEAYAVLDTVTGTLSWYCDENRPARTGISGLCTGGFMTPEIEFTAEQIKKVVIDKSFADYPLTRVQGQFKEYVNLTEVEGLGNLNLDDVHSLQVMFQYCTSLKKIDLSALKTDSVRNMFGMFNACYALEEINLKNLNTSKVTNFSSMFSYCTSLKKVDVSSFDVSSATDFSTMFEGCTSLITIICEKDWSIRDAESERMFNDCKALRGNKGSGLHNVFLTNRIYARPDGGESHPGYFTIPSGKLKGLFTINKWTGEQVVFSNSNLQYQSGTDTWRLAENQWDRAEKGWKDMFAWGTGADPASTDRQAEFTDWGTNAISRGALEPNYWRTLTDAEWYCLFKERDYNDLWGAATVNDVHGVVILPDCWSAPRGLNFQKKANKWTDNVYTKVEWEAMENHGALFLPVGGYKETDDKLINSDVCYYWSATQASSTSALAMTFGSGFNNPSQNKQYRMCVRLVRNAGDEELEPDYATSDEPCDNAVKTVGVFSVSADRKVTFSQGNLQYCDSMHTYRFAENQYDVVGEDNTRIGRYSSYWVDLFGWGTGDRSYFYSNNNAKFPEFVDWGTNPICNGGNEPDYWRTLTQAEWDYIYRFRDNAQLLRGRAIVNGVKGWVLLPDGWSTPAELNFTSGNHQKPEDNTFTAEQWAVMEAWGAVFLPCAGMRDGNGTFSQRNVVGQYWAATPFNDDQTKAYYASYAGGGYDFCSTTDKKTGMCVRLVRDTVVPNPEPIEAYETLEPYEGEVKEIGVFSIGDAKKVMFSQGNLQYQASSNTFRFAENQYDCISEADNQRVGKKSTFWIDHFGWGTGDRPYLYSNQAAAYPEFVDWGTNPIWNGGNEPGQWRTLTGKEWSDLLNNNHIRPLTLRTRATVADVPGYILLPDNWVLPDGINMSPGLSNVHYATNKYTAEQWSILEQAGAVFLPSAGYRQQIENSSVFSLKINDLNNDAIARTGYYWASTEGDAAKGDRVTFSDNGWNYTGSFNKEYGYSVRLVKDLVVKPIPTGEETTFDFSVMNAEGSDILGVLLAEEDKYNEAEKRVEINTTYDVDSINHVIEREWDGKIAPKTFLPGTINFKLDEVGEGNIEIDCQTNGYVLSVGLAEYGKATITSTIDQLERGKATVHYTISQPTYVVIYLYSASSSSASRRGTRARKTAESGAHIYSIKIAPFIPMPITAKQDPDASGNYYSTFYDSAKKYALPEGTEAYTAKIDAEGNMVLTPIAEGNQVIPANTAVILKATTPSFTLAQSDNTPVSASDDNQLLGVDEPTLAPENCYVLSGRSADNTVQGVGFYLFNGTLAAHKAYLIYNGTPLAPSHRMRFVFSEEQTATGMDELQKDNVQRAKLMENGVLYIIKNGVRYNAQGQMVK